MKAGMGGKLGISGTFECKDKDGNVLKVIEFKGSVPLSDELTAEQAQEMIQQQEATNGSINHE